MNKRTLPRKSGCWLTEVKQERMYPLLTLGLGNVFLLRSGLAPLTAFPLLMAVVASPPCVIRTILAVCSVWALHTLIGGACGTCMFSPEK